MISLYFMVKYFFFEFIGYRYLVFMSFCVKIQLPNFLLIPIINSISSLVLLLLFYPS